MEFQYEYAGKSYPVRIKKDGETFKVGIGDDEYAVRSKLVREGNYILYIDGKPVKISMSSEGNQRHIFFNGAVYRFTRSEGKRKKSDEYDTLSPLITSPISGKVVKVDAENGMLVEAGQTLLTIEAMKMEYQIKAPYDGTVKSLKFKGGEQVEIGAVLVEMVKKEVEGV